MKTHTSTAPEGFFDCCRCRVAKPLSEFARTSLVKRGHEARCRTCRRLPLSSTVAQRFEKRVIRGDGCWLWNGSHSQNGRPNLYVGGLKTMELAYRVAWELAGNVAPQWPYVLDHICKNVGCVKPAHLRVVLQADNCCALAPTSVSHKNAAKNECDYGHPLSGANLAIRPAGRVCLTCVPSAWMWAVERRDPPPRARCKEWHGPHQPQA